MLFLLGLLEWGGIEILEKGQNSSRSENGVKLGKHYEENTIVLKIGILSKRKTTFQINSKVVEIGDSLVTIFSVKAARRGVPVVEERSECVCLFLTFQSEITN